jgi:heme exporter protein D
MGWSIYLMLGMVALMVLSIVVLIVRSEKQRARRMALVEEQRAHSK